MDISAAALPPTQPATSANDRAHPRFAEYRRYVSAMSFQLVEASPFASWLRQTEECEHDLRHGRAVVFRTQPGATLPDGWYKHKFAPGSGRMTRLGPFATEAEAAAS